jgi:uric acid transporter
MEQVVEQQKIHPVDEKLPAWQLFVYGLQHVLAMYSGAVAVPLILAGALHLDKETLIYIINADLFTCGVATVIQTLSCGPYIGSKLPIMQGCTFAAVTPMIMIGSGAGGGLAGLQTVYGSVIVAGAICFLVSKYFSKMLRYFPPVVTGTVVTIIGLSLMPVAVMWIGGGNPTAKDFCDPSHIALSLLVLCIILFFYRTFKGFWSNISVLMGLIIGTVAALALGLVDFSSVGAAGFIGITTPFAFGIPIFDPASIFAMTVVMLVVMAETTGDVIAISEIVDKPVKEGILANALRADGFSTMLGGFLNAFPYTAFAQNIGLVSLTGVRSRFVVATGGLILMVLGLIPKLAAIVACVPNSVLGGAGIAMFGMVAASGIKTLSKIDFDESCNMMIVAVSIGIALIPVGVPDFYAKFPAWSQLILKSGITIGSVVAIVLNVILNGAKKQDPKLAPREYL